MSISRRFRAVTASAASVLLGVIAVQSADAGRIIPLVDPGSGFDSGWRAEVADGIDLTIFSVQGDFTSLSLEKLADFTNAPDEGFLDPLRITFFQVNSRATSKIRIADEYLLNNTGTNWTGFTWKIETGAVGPKFDVAGSNGFNIDPFTSEKYSEDDTRYTVQGGGVISADDGGGLGNVYTPGLQNGSLVIDAAPYANGSSRRTFVLKEQPLIGEQPLIPLPAAAWSALSGLLGIAVIAKAGKVRQLLA